jgi:hypothetical protein
MPQGGAAGAYGPSATVDDVDSDGSYDGPPLEDVVD